MSDYVVKKLSYSHNPWRIIHVASGCELCVEFKEYPGFTGRLCLPPIAVYGYPTKKAAKEALDKWLARKTATL